MCSLFAACLHAYSLDPLLSVRMYSAVSRLLMSDLVALLSSYEGDMPALDIGMFHIL